MPFNSFSFARDKATRDLFFLYAFVFTYTATKFSTMQDSSAVYIFRYTFIN